jgi:hypothetical protein
MSIGRSEAMEKRVKNENTNEQFLTKRVENSWLTFETVYT